MAMLSFVALLKCSALPSGRPHLFCLYASSALLATGKNYYMAHAMAIMSSDSDGYIGKFLKKADSAVREGVKKADEVLDEAVEVGTISAKEAAKTGKKLGQQAQKENLKIQKRARKTLEAGIKSAKSVRSNPMQDLELLEKLGELKERGLITEREYQAKKKKLLDRI